MNWKDFSFGLAIGCFISTAFYFNLNSKTQNEKQKNRMSLKPNNVIEEIKKNKPHVILNTKELENRIFKSETSSNKNSSTLINEKSQTVSYVESKTATLTLDLNLVSALEKEWDDLRNQALLQSQQGGWKVVFIKPNSTFAKSGLIEGDIIKNDYIQKMKESDQSGENLSGRVINILRQVE